MEISEDDKPFMPLEDKDFDPTTHSVVHCVQLQLRQDPDEKSLRHLLARVRMNVPGLIELHFGKNDVQMYRGKNEVGGGNTHALVSRHANAQALRVYQKHPEHVALSRLLLALVERPPHVIDFVNMPSQL